MNTARLNQGNAIVAQRQKQTLREKYRPEPTGFTYSGRSVCGGGGPQRWWQKSRPRLLAGLETPTAGDVLAGTTPLAGNSGIHAE